MDFNSVVGLATVSFYRTLLLHLFSEFGDQGSNVPYVFSSDICGLLHPPCFLAFLSIFGLLDAGVYIKSFEYKTETF